jgi:simple sugar transport system ATP-binding protein
MSTNGTPLLDVRNISKYFGSVIALKDVSMWCRAGEVTCLLGDNGAGKSTLIKTLSGVYTPDDGEYLFDGEARRFDSPREALELGIATVYQDLAMIPLLSIWRNFFLGSEPTKGFWPFRRFDVKSAKDVSRGELGKMGIDIRDPEQPVGTLSGGERQSVAIARAVYFGAKVLILDEPTAALGVKQAGVVLRYIVQAKQRGVGVIFITHNPHHAYPVGDHFVILRRGQVFGDYAKEEIGLDHLVQMMAGGEELANLAHELERAVGKAEGDVGDVLARAAEALETEARAAESAEAEASLVVDEPVIVDEPVVLEEPPAAAPSPDTVVERPEPDNPEPGAKGPEPGG